MGNKIYLIRHVEVEKPEEKIFAGAIDLKLSREGIRHAEMLGSALSMVKPGGIYCSSSGRAVHTANIISKRCSCSYEMVPGLQEINLGQWDGKSFEEIKSKYPREFIERGRDMFHYKIPGGESFQQVQQRAWNAFLKIANHIFGGSFSKDAVIVSHAGVNKTIISKITGKDFNECFNMKQQYGCINLVTKIENGYCISVDMPLKDL